LWPFARFSFLFSFFLPPNFTQNNSSSSNYNNNNNNINAFGLNSHDQPMGKSSMVGQPAGGSGNVEQILKEMSSISSLALLPEIAATPRKEMESKFALNQMGQPSKHKYVPLPPSFMPSSSSSSSNNNNNSNNKPSEYPF
jgi:hypothetical protein